MNVTKDSDKHSVKWECLCLLHYKHLYSWWRITLTICIPSKIKKISQWNRSSTHLQNWCPNKMRSMEWKQLIGKIIHGNICHKLVTKESSIFSARSSTSFRILCCALRRFSKTFNRTMHGNKDWIVSKHLRNTETCTASQWNSSGMFSQDTIRCSSVKKSKLIVEIRWDTREFHRKDYIHVDVQRGLLWIKRQWKRMRVKCSTRLYIYIYMQRDLE